MIIEIIAIWALVSGLVACIWSIAKRPPLVTFDEADMQEFIRSKMRADARVRELEAREAGGPVVETYYDVLSRLAGSKENQN